MQNDMILAGFGGQGVLLIGKMLAYAGMKEGKEVSWLPSYGPEMRGGTCNCTVVVSDKPVGSPVVRTPRIVVALNRPSLDKFEPSVKEKGILLINSSLINPTEVSRKDIEVLPIPANDIAKENGHPRLANMVALGAFVEKTKLVRITSLFESFEKILDQRYHPLIPSNIKAVEEGGAFVQSLP